MYEEYLCHKTKNLFLTLNTVSAPINTIYINTETVKQIRDVTFCR